MRRAWRSGDTARGVARHGQSLLGGVAALTFALAASAHELERPVPVARPSPRWPSAESHAHDVLVNVELSVDATGRVSFVRVVDGAGAPFDAAARAIVRRWRYRPAREDGRPTSSRIRETVRFNHAAADFSPDDGRSAASGTPARRHAHKPPTHPVRTAGAAGDESDAASDVVVRGHAPMLSASDKTIDRDVLRAAPHRTGADMLRTAPGVFTTQHGGEGKATQIFLRGFDAAHGQDIELWVGGVPVNDVSNIHGQGYADLNFVMPELVREIRALPGPFSVTQGDFAVAGSLRMHLGYDEPGLTAKASAGSFGGRRLFLAYHPEHASEETFAAFEHYTTNGFGPNRAASRTSAMAQGRYKLGRRLSVRLLGSSYAGRFDSAGVLREEDIDSGRVDRLATYDPKQGGASNRHQLLVELHGHDKRSTTTVAPFVIVRSLSLRQNYTGRLHGLQAGLNAPYETDNTAQRHDALTLGTRASYERRVDWLSRRDSVVFGALARVDRIDQDQTRLSIVDDRVLGRMVDATILASHAAGYASARVHPIKRVALTAGLRADGLAFDIREPDASGAEGPTRHAFGLHLGKKATVDVLAARGLHLIASYGEGFRSPQARSLTNGESAPLTTARSVEVGARQNVDSRLEASLAGFHTRLSDDLVFDERTGRNERAPSTSRTGCAADIVVRPLGWMVLSTSGTWVHAMFAGSNDRYGEGDQLPYVPELVVRQDWGARVELGTLLRRPLVMTTGVGLHALVGRPLPFSERGRGIFVADARAALRLREVELGVDVMNVLDARYYDSQFVYASSFGAASSLVPARHVTIGAPRTIFFSLTLYV